MAYFPNGSSGEILDAQCANCPLGFGWNDPRQGQLFDAEREPKPCPVLFVQLEFNYTQCDDSQKELRRAMSCLISDDGICQTRKLLVELRSEESQRLALEGGAK